MTPLAAITLAVALAGSSGRVESVGFVSLGAGPGLRVVLSDGPVGVSVSRQGDVARVSLSGATLGYGFSGADRFHWVRASAASGALPAAAEILEDLQIVKGPGEVSLYLRVPPEIAVDVRRDRRAVTLVLRSPGARPQPSLSASVLPPPTAAPRPPAVTAPAPIPEPLADQAAVAAAPMAARPPEPPVPTPSARDTEPPVPAPPATAPPSEARPEPSTVELAKALFPPPTAEPTVGAASLAALASSAESGPHDTASLYTQLFPYAQGQAPPAPIPAAGGSEGGTGGTPLGEGGLHLGPVKLRPSLSLTYLNEQATLESANNPVRDKFLEVQPGVALETRVGEGRLSGEYGASLRAFTTFDVVGEPSQRANVSLDLPVGTRATVKASDQFFTGVLETRQVDPGREYFLNLGRFNRNAAVLGTSIMVGPRLSLDLRGELGKVRFDQPSGFFDYDTRLASTGLGYELTPTLRATLSYLYDEVPSPDERPEAEARAHSVEVGLSGDILPLLSGQVVVAYRDQQSPNADTGGRSFQGLTTAASLARVLGQNSSLRLGVSRSTPVSNFEGNAFYVSTAVSAAFAGPLPASLTLEAGAAYRWNDYRTIATEIGDERNDKIFDWFIGLRRPIRRLGYLRAGYRQEHRQSNIDTFDTTTDALVLQLDLNLFGSATR